MFRGDEDNNAEAWCEDDNVINQWGYKKFGDCVGIEISTSEGWINVRRIVRHETEKKYL